RPAARRSTRSARRTAGQTRTPRRSARPGRVPASSCYLQGWWTLQAPPTVHIHRCRSDGPKYPFVAVAARCSVRPQASRSAYDASTRREPAAASWVYAFEVTHWGESITGEKPGQRDVAGT